MRNDRTQARTELLAAVDEFDVSAGVANVRLVNAIEGMIMSIMSGDRYPTFEVVETFEIDGKGTAYRGFAPFDMDNAAIGAFVTVEGVSREIIGIERGARMPQQGEPCVLMLGKLKQPIYNAGKSP